MSPDKINQNPLSPQDAAALHSYDQSIDELHEQREKVMHEKISFALNDGKTPEELVALGFSKKMVEEVIQNAGKNTPDTKPTDENDKGNTTEGEIKEGDDTNEDPDKELHTQEEELKNQEILKTLKEIRILNEREKQLDIQIQQIKRDLAELDEQERIEREEALKIQNGPQPNTQQEKIDKHDDLETLSAVDRISEEMRLLEAQPHKYIERKNYFNKFNKKIRELKKEFKEAVRIEKYIGEVLAQDHKGKEFMYFTAYQITSPHLRKILRNNKAALLDLRFLLPNTQIGEGRPNKLKIINETEAVLGFNTLGFMKVLKDVESYRHDGEIDINNVIYSNQGFYKIIGPDGAVVADNIEGYRQTEQTYDQLSQEYKNKVEQEFNKLHK